MISAALTLAAALLSTESDYRDHICGAAGYRMEVRMPNGTRADLLAMSSTSCVQEPDLVAFLGEDEIFLCGGDRETRTCRCVRIGAESNVTVSRCTKPPIMLRCTSLGLGRNDKRAVGGRCDDFGRNDLADNDLRTGTGNSVVIVDRYDFCIETCKSHVRKPLITSGTPSAATIGTLSHSPHCSQVSENERVTASGCQFDDSRP